MTPSKKAQHINWMRAVIAQHQTPLIRYARQLVGDLDTARDVVQETFLRLWKADREQVEDHVAQWLFTVCRNRALDVRRKEGRMQSLPSHTSQTMSDERVATPSEVVEKRQSLAQVLKALDALPQRQQEVLRLKFQQGLSYRQISKITGLSVSNVGYQIHAGVKALRAHVAKQDQPKSRRAS